MFCVHPAGGSSSVYKALTDWLPETLPVYGLQAKILSDGGIGHQSIREMAGCYVSAMRQVQPEGPYRLLGWSFGGVVVREMAAQLEAAALQVELMVLLDSPFGDEAELHAQDQNQSKLLMQHADELGIAHAGLSDMEIKAALLAEAGLLPNDANINEIDLIIKAMMQASSLIMQHADPNRLSCSIIYVRANNNLSTHLDEKLAAMTSGVVRIVDVDANHARMCDAENSKAVAAILVTSVC